MCSKYPEIVGTAYSIYNSLHFKMRLLKRICGMFLL